MKVLLKGIFFIILFPFIFFSCDNSDSVNNGTNSSDLTFDTSIHVGDVVTVSFASESFNMVYANNQTSITFPISSINPDVDVSADNSGSATLSTKFFIGESEVTNSLFAYVLQWAYNTGKLNINSSQSDSHNFLNTLYAKYGNQRLISFADSKISQSLGIFSVETGFENYPVVGVSWYGAVIFCNWLTEIIDSNALEVVYSGIPTDGTVWEASDTLEDPLKKGLRLPSSEEWEYCARYIGKTAPVEGDLASEYIALNHNSGSSSLTPGYFWSPGDYASGATANYNTFSATTLVAWFGNTLVVPDGNTTILKAINQKKINQLGLYDMSGNVVEWCFTVRGENRVCRGGCYRAVPWGLQVGLVGSGWPYFIDSDSLGFRLAKYL